MAKGSALKRLKQTLSTAGVIGPQKKSKKGNPKDRPKVDPSIASPFDTRTTKTKFDVLGKNKKSTKGKPAVSRQLGEEKRRKTLLQEMQRKHKAGGLIDRRIGENDPHLNPEEKMLERFTRERRAHVTSLYNLEESGDLTHYGQSLAGMDDFDDAGLGMSDDEGGIEDTIVSKMHFGGFGDDEDEGEDDEGRKKSKAEIMKEVIAKSKFHKYERQREKEEDEEKMHQLDDELGDIQQFLELSKPVRRPLPSQNAAFSKAEDLREQLKAEEPANEEVEADDYDTFVREMALDRRAAPTDRLKMDEEIAAEEKEKLEKAELARKRRMQGLEVGEEADGPRKKRKAPQADDLEDDFAQAEDASDFLGEGLQTDAAPGEEDVDEDEEGEEDEEEEDVDVSSDDGADDSDLELTSNNKPVQHDTVEKSESVAEGSKAEEANGKQDAKQSEVPYVFPCPADHASFLRILKPLRLVDQPLVVFRIRTLYHIKLAAENRAKLERFFDVLVDHVSYLLQRHPNVTTLKVINKLTKQLFDMVQTMPEHATESMLNRLDEMHKELLPDSSVGQAAWPDLSQLAQLRLLGLILPTSDYHHKAVTPAVLLMGQLLSQTKLQNVKDVIRGLMLCQIFLDYQAYSKRFVPEVGNYLALVMGMFLWTDDEDGGLKGLFPTKQNDIGSLAITNQDISDVPPIYLTQMDPSTDADDQAKCQILSTALHLVCVYIDLFSSNAALVELVTPLKRMTERLTDLSLPQFLQTRVKTVDDRLTKQIKFASEKRQKTPIAMQAHKPIPIATYLPKFEEGYSLEKRYDPDYERSQAAKLKSQYKKERKGAIRELRKDAAFVARERLRDQKAKDEVYKQKMSKAMSILEQEQGEKNKEERERQKRKKR